MTRFGDFTLLDDLGRSAVADRFKATHATQGGPFFVKAYTRLDVTLHDGLMRRCEALAGKRHPNLVRHLGHGVAEGVPFVVAPYLEGIALDELAESLRDRRVHLSLEAALIILSDLAAAVGALHSFRAPGAPFELAHGEVALTHVRLGMEGQVWLTGLTTPRGDGPTRPAEARWDIPGVGALIYDLVPLMRGGAARPPLPVPLDRVVRRALGIGAGADRVAPGELAERLADVGRTLGLRLEREPFVELIRRTTRVVERKLAEAGGRASPQPPGRTPSGTRRGAADANTSPNPVGLIPTLDPLQPLHQIPSVATAANRATPRVADRELTPSPRVPALEDAASSHAYPRTHPLPAGPPGSLVRRPSLADPPETPRALSAPAPWLAIPVAPVLATIATAQAAQAQAAQVAQAAQTAKAETAKAETAKAETAKAETAKAETAKAETAKAEIAKAQAAQAERSRDVTGVHLRAVHREKARHDRGLQALIKRGLVDDAALAAALDEHAARGGRVLELLAARGVIHDAAIADVLAQESGMARMPDETLQVRRPPAALVRRVPHTYLLARRVLPLSFEHGVLVIAVANPYDTGTLDELRGLLAPSRVEAFVAARTAITNATVAVVRTLGAGSSANAAEAPPRALLCMEDETKATRIGARLVQEGIHVEHVADGNMAHEVLSTRPPDVMLCAHDLPRTPVSALLLAVRGEVATAELPFFVFGPKDDELAAQLLDLGADDYFGDPLKLDLVLAKLRRAVGKGRVLRPEGFRLQEAIVPAPVTVQPLEGPFKDSTSIAAVVPEERAVHASPDTQAPPAGAADQLAIEGLDDLPELPDFASPQGNDGATIMPTGVMGTLRQMPLPEIVQSLEMGRKTARVDIVPADGEKGVIAFDGGQVRYAECGTLSANEAFFMLARHKEGFFRIHYGTKPPAVNIEVPTTFLLLEAMRRIDEASAASPAPLDR